MERSRRLAPRNLPVWSCGRMLECFTDCETRTTENTEITEETLCGLCVSVVPVSRIQEAKVESTRRCRVSSATALTKGRLNAHFCCRCRIDRARFCSGERRPGARSQPDKQDRRHWSDARHPFDERCRQNTGLLSRSVWSRRSGAPISECRATDSD